MEQPDSNDNALMGLLRDQNNLLTELIEVQKKVLWHTSQSRSLLDSSRIEASRETLARVAEFFDNRQLSLLSSLAVVKSERINLSRFGDGEIKLMSESDYNLAFQKNSPELRQALADVFTLARSDPHKLLIGMVPMIHTQFWTQFYTAYWHQIEPHFAGIQRLANSHMSRPKIFMEHGQAAVDAWSQVWDGLHVVIVTGKGSRFGLEPALFGSAASITFEQSYATDAFADLPRVVEKLSHGQQDLVLVSLGPAGSILPAQLAAHDKWALDIGHLSSSYATVFQGAPSPEITPMRSES